MKRRPDDKIRLSDVLATPELYIFLAAAVLWWLALPLLLALTITILVAGACIGVHSLWGSYREWKRHRSSGHGFLCPRCLQFGRFQFACGACKKRIGAFVVYTNGTYWNQCLHCRARLLSRHRAEGWGVRA
jgi:hypothetical protein